MNSMDTDGYSPNRSHLAQPRPFNPDLDIHIDPNLMQPPKLLTIPFSNVNDFQNQLYPKVQNDRVWKEQDFQLAVIPSDSSSISSDISIHDIPSDSLNDRLKRLGLPLLDLSRVPLSNPDQFVFLPFGSSLVSKLYSRISGSL